MGLIKKIYNLHIELSEYYSNIYKTEITREEVFWAIFMLSGDKFDMRYALDIWHVDMTADEAKTLLKDFDFDILKLPVEMDVVPDIHLMQRKARFKAAGQIWVIHKYDADPFPSNPHAHQLEDNLKLDLSNGNYFRNRKLISKVSKKDLIKIRLEAKKVFSEALPEIQV